MTFHLRTLPFGTTLSRQIAKQHLSRFNNVFWVGERSFRHLKSAYKEISFPAPGPGIHGVFASDQEWEEATDEYHAWMRHHILISAASLLEVYVKSASTTAVTAKPELVDRSFAGVDGFRFVKDNPPLPKHLAKLTESVTTGFVDGTWEERLRRIGRVFGAIPAALNGLAPNLQNIQTKRNKISHQFGNELKNRRTPWDAFKFIEVGPKEIIDGITSISTVIKIMDVEIFGPAIGGHEVLHEYHVWSKKQRNFHHLYVSGRLSSAFRDHIGGVYGAALGTDYIDGMINYYNRV